MKNLSNFILESLNKNDYKKISDKIIKQFNISSINDKGFVDDYVEYVGNNLINNGEWQDIDEDFDKFVESQSLLPKVEVTQKGNVAEIILVEYLRETTSLSPIIHKLRYNTNVEQSMKGDDVLLLNPTNVFEKVIQSEMSYLELSDYLVDKYTGFTVYVEEVKEIETIGSTNKRTFKYSANIANLQ